MTNKNRLEDDDDICSVVILDALSAKNMPSDPYSQINIKAYFEKIIPNKNKAKNVKTRPH